MLQKILNLPEFFGESVETTDSSSQLSRDFTLCFFAADVELCCGFGSLGETEMDVDLLVVVSCVVVVVVVVVKVVKESGVAVLVVIILSVSQDSSSGCFVMVSTFVAVSLFTFGAIVAVV